MAKKIDFGVIGDERGKLVSLEGQKNVPFDINRVYYIFDTEDGVERGFHAHKKLEQVLVAISGQCTVVLDNGLEREEVVLSSCAEALYIDSVVWREMKDFSPGAVLLVLASEYYDESDYIRNYDDFLGFIGVRGSDETE